MCKQTIYLGRFRKREFMQCTVINAAAVEELLPPPSRKRRQKRHTEKQQIYMQEKPSAETKSEDQPSSSGCNAIFIPVNEILSGAEGNPICLSCAGDSESFISRLRILLKTSLILFCCPLDFIAILHTEEEDKAEKQRWKMREILGTSLDRARDRKTHSVDHPYTSSPLFLVLRPRFLPSSLFIRTAFRVIFCIFPLAHGVLCVTYRWLLSSSLAQRHVSSSDVWLGQMTTQSKVSNLWPPPPLLCMLLAAWCQNDTMPATTPGCLQSDPFQVRKKEKTVKNALSDESVSLEIGEMWVERRF